FQAEDGIRDGHVTGVQTCALPISGGATGNPPFSNLDPTNANPITTTNALQNFGWEYVWHCHILGHEENDMMRPIIYQVPPAAPRSEERRVGKEWRAREWQ